MLYVFVLCFGGWALQKKAFSDQNKGHLGSRWCLPGIENWVVTPVFPNAPNILFEGV